MKGILIPTNVFEPLELVDINSNDDLGKHLGNVYIERVVVGDYLTKRRFTVDGTIVVMYVDDEGLIKGLVRNHRASILYGSPIHDHFIHGPALLVGESFSQGEYEIDHLPLKYRNTQFWDDFFANTNA